VTEFNPLLHNLRPTNFRQGEWVPEAWDPNGPDNQPNSRLTIALPGEFATGVVLRVVTPNAVVEQLGGCMMTGRGHDYRAKDIIPVRREDDGLGGERWCAVSERELQMNEMIGRFIEIEKALGYPAPGEKAKALPSPEIHSEPIPERGSSDPTELGPGEEDRTVEPERGRYGHSSDDFRSRVSDGERSLNFRLKTSGCGKS